VTGSVDHDFPAAASDELRSVLAATVAPWPEVPAVVLAVLHGDSWLKTAWSPQADVDPEAAFRTASVTKTFTAATALRLVEQGRLDLDGPIRARLSPVVAELLPRLVRRPDDVTLRHLLQHTAGVADCFPEPDWPDLVIREPQRRYELIEVLRRTAECLEPIGDVGGESQYSDTGYLLTVDLINTASGLPWPRAMRELLDYGRHGLHNTWVEEREPPPVPAPTLAPSNLRGVDMWSIHPSYDTLGGGGLVSTAPDLARFFAALLAGRVVQPETLAQMQRTVPYRGDRAVGLGLFPRDTALGTAWGHTGVHGAFAFAVQDKSLTIAGSICSLDYGYHLTQPAWEVASAVATALVRYVDRPAEM
jgi:D-alanyl-D-alanine carboxypeptidase